VLSANASPSATPSIAQASRASLPTTPANSAAADAAAWRSSVSETASKEPVADVEVAAACHRQAQLVAGAALVEQGSGAIKSAALHTGNRRPVGQLDVLADVAGRKEHPVPRFADDCERSVGMPFGDPPHGPVDDFSVGLGAHPAAVVASHDSVANPGPGAVAQLDAGGLDVSCGDPHGPGGASELGDGVVIAGDHHRVPEGQPIVPPFSHDRSDHVVAGPPRIRPWSS
jgi:hypothetical protein